MTVRVHGGPRLRRTLKRAGVDMGDLAAANRVLAGSVATAAKALAPRRTGRLAGDIRGQGGQTRARIAAGRKTVPYAGPIHWGWTSRRIVSNPFLTRAAKAEEPSIVRLYLEHVTTVARTVKGA